MTKFADAHTAMLPLEGRRAIVTGGTTGIGRAIAVLLASDGVKVHICGRDPRHLEDALARIAEVGDGAGTAIDLAEDGAVERYFDKATAWLGGLDIAIINAAESADALGDTSLADLRYKIASDFTGYLVSARAALDHFSGNDPKGDIVLIGSMSAHVLGGGSTVYAGIKAGIAGFAEALRREQGEKGVRVSLVEPGFTGSDMTDPDKYPEARKIEEIAKAKMLRAEDIAVGVRHVLTQPSRVTTQQMTIVPRARRGMMLDHLVLTPHDIDLSRSPLAGKLGAETYILGAFNPGMTRLANGNLLLMVRVAEALRTPVFGGNVHAIRWAEDGYRLDPWPLQLVDTADPRKFTIPGGGGRVMALTSLSWLLPVELDAEGTRIEAIHYDRAITPRASYQCYGVEDARISKVGNRYLMTTCSVSPERHCTTLYTSSDALDWQLEGIVLDHQNKDMLIFEDLIDGQYWAQTRPLGDLYFAYPPDSEWRAGPSINLARSPDALHWKPHDAPGIRPHAATVATARMGGGAPPILTDAGWLTLWHGVEPSGMVGIYRTYWSLLDRDDPARTIRTSHDPLLEPAPALTEPIKDLMYLENVVFTTGIADAGDHYVVASGEADLACRITHVGKDVFG